MFEDKETETEMLAGELDRTRDIVSALQDENRELKVSLLNLCLFRSIPSYFDISLNIQI